MQSIYIILALAIGIGGGILFGYQMRKMWAVKKKDALETKVETLINDAKAKQKQILLEANDKALKVLEDAKAEEKVRQQELTRSQKRLESREALFDQRILDLESKKQ